MSDDAIAPPSLAHRNPRLGASAFVCPHCKAFAQQQWFTLHANLAKDPPNEIDTAEMRKRISALQSEQRRKGEEVSPFTPLNELLAAVDDNILVVQRNSSGYYVYSSVGNAHASSCFACKRASFWIGGKVRFPVANAEVPEPNVDLPPDIRRDYVEAGEVVSASPRAAAALLRLSIEKLCAHVLEREAKINTMIGDLVARGLSPMIQRALDVVRVVGNEAIHPGSIDLRDDQVTAMQLFGLVNLIAEQMITQPKHVMALYGTLPPDKIAGIEQRDAKARMASEPEA
jgi:hypothetical protein